MPDAIVFRRPPFGAKAEVLRSTSSGRARHRPSATNLSACSRLLPWLHWSRWYEMPARSADASHTSSISRKAALTSRMTVWSARRRHSAARSRQYVGYDSSRGVIGRSLAPARPLTVPAHEDCGSSHALPRSPETADDRHWVFVVAYQHHSRL